jgi:signal transduction histidine kinase
MIDQQTFLWAIQRVNHIAANVELDELLEQALELLINLTAAQGGMLCLYDTAANHLVLEVVQGTLAFPYEPGQVLPVEDSSRGYTPAMTQAMFLAGMPSADTTTAYSEKSSAQIRGIFPLILNNQRPVGLVEVFNVTPLAADDYEQQDLLHTLLMLLATHIDKARQLQDAQRRTRRLMNLFDILSCMVTTLESQRLLDDIMIYARELLNVETTSIWLKDETTGEMKLHIATSTPREHAQEIRVPAGEGIIGHVTSTGVSVVVNDVHQDEHFYASVDQQLGFITHSILCVPLQAPHIQRPLVQGIITEDIIGGAQAVNKRDGKPFNDEDRILFEMLASQAATILQILWLYETAEAAQRQRVAAEDANRAKSIFLSNMSHELRTPLNAIIGYSELLAEDAQDAGYEDILNDLMKIRSSGAHLLTIINDILDISKIEAGKMELHPEIFEINVLIDNVVATMHQIITKKGNKLEVFVGPETGKMYTDLVKVRQCLFNLLSNANKFTDYGTITLTAQRKTAPETQDTTDQHTGERIIFQVADTGIGIAPEHMHAIFDAFSQGDTSTTRTQGGTGLGLAITRKFCLMMGGDLNVTSTVGEGSTFTILLPVNIPQNALHTV